MGLLSNYNVDMADFDKRIVFDGLGEEPMEFATNTACHIILERASKDPLVDSVDIYVLDPDDISLVSKLRVRPKLIPLILFDPTMDPIDLCDNDMVYNNLVHYRDGIVTY